MAPALEQPHIDVMAHAASFPQGNLGEYSIMKDIGEGTFGKVKREFCFCFVLAFADLHTHSVAVHTMTQAKVALKFISKERINALNMHTRVNREVSYLRLLRHPHVIKL